MSGLLAHITEGFDRRMALRRRMIAHLALVPRDLTGGGGTGVETAAVQLALRDTLRACSACRDPAACQSWLDHGQSGLPLFCPGRGAFVNLSAAVSREAAE